MSRLSPSRSRTLRLEAGSVLAAILVLVVAAGLAIATFDPFDWRLPTLAALVFSIVALLALAHLGAHSHAGFGPANVITSFRAGITALLAGLVPAADALTAPAMAGWAWGFALLAFASLALDGLDGYAARRLGSASPFGGRYDMEVDALLMLVLSAIAYRLGHAGAFVLLLGLMRYAFVAAAWCRPALGAPLPESRRRKAVCAGAVAALGFLVTPLAAPPVGGAVALAALLVLAWSFALDLRRLLLRAGGEPAG